MDNLCDANIDRATPAAIKYADLTSQSAHGWSRPKRLETGTDGLRADQAARLVSQGVGIVWEGDFFEGRSLLQAVKRRLSTKTSSQTQATEALPWPDRFHRIRLQRAQSARQLGLLLVHIGPDFTLNYRRAPDAKEALAMAYGERLANTDFLMPLTELMGVLSAYEWHRKGLPVTPLGASIYPRWGVFAPTRHEYLDLVMQADLPESCQSAVDVGTGTGVLALLLA
ncbi:MAG TPA: methyltransferase, partial [Orrella sp.]